MKADRGGAAAAALLLLAAQLPAAAGASVPMPLVAGGPPDTGTLAATTEASAAFSVPGTACPDGWLTVTAYDMSRQGAQLALSSTSTLASPLLMLQSGSIPTATLDSNANITVSNGALVDVTGAGGASRNPPGPALDICLAPSSFARRRRPASPPHAWRASSSRP